MQPDIIAAGNTADALSESGPQPTNDHIHADAQMEPCKAADAFMCMSSAECVSEVCSVAYRDESVNYVAISTTSMFGTNRTYQFLFFPASVFTSFDHLRPRLQCFHLQLTK